MRLAFMSGRTQFFLVLTKTSTAMAVATSHSGSYGPASCPMVPVIYGTTSALPFCSVGLHCNDYCECI